MTDNQRSRHDQRHRKPAPRMRGRMAATVAHRGRDAVSDTFKIELNRAASETRLLALEDTKQFASRSVDHD
jgi:hypothetical protein